jgi:hypothetical protein
VKSDLVGRGSGRFQVLGSKFYVRRLILYPGDASYCAEGNLEPKPCDLEPRTVSGASTKSPFTFHLSHLASSWILAPGSSTIPRRA